MLHFQQKCGVQKSKDFDFRRKKYSFHMISRNFPIIGQGVLEIQGVTDRQTDRFEDLLYRWKLPD